MTDEREEQGAPVTPAPEPAEVVEVVEVEVVTIAGVPMPHSDEIIRSGPAPAASSPWPSPREDIENEPVTDAPSYLGHQAKGEIEGEPPDIEA